MVTATTAWEVVGVFCVSGVESGQVHQAARDEHHDLHDGREQRAGFLLLEMMGMPFRAARKPKAAS